jgi:hypothetical protein
MSETGGKEQVGYVGGTWLLSSLDLLTRRVPMKAIKEGCTG